MQPTRELSPSFPSTYSRQLTVQIHEGLVPATISHATLLLLLALDSSSNQVPPTCKPLLYSSSFCCFTSIAIHSSPGVASPWQSFRNTVGCGLVTDPSESLMHSSDHLPLHLIGTPAFFPAVLSHIRSHATSASVPLDSVIFQSILLCIVAGDKHLILRTPEEDIGLVVKLAVWVSYFINVCFGSPNWLQKTSLVWVHLRLSPLFWKSMVSITGVYKTPPRESPREAPNHSSHGCLKLKVAASSPGMHQHELAPSDVPCKTGKTHHPLISLNIGCVIVRGY